ncbi:MAG TPA: gamma-glutamyltransferase [Fimbriimonadaceae bacterium]|nr:gamma-glutamyltransferase [Fimbriimonadaceae bacterium]
MTSAVLLLTISQIHPVRFAHGAVVSDSTLASQVGADILKQGGNAVDAAVAVGFALAVTFPAAGNLGGGGFMLVRMANGRSVAIDYRETAPEAATPDMYRNGRSSTTGYLASGVPGTVMGMHEAHKRFGKLPWARVVAPSIRLARDGFKVGYGLADDFRRERARFKQFPASWAQFCRNGKFYAAGETLKQPDLAKTLQLIQSKGPDGFYEGAVAAKIESAMSANKGIITRNDLKHYKVKLRTPLQATYKGHGLITMPPPSSGGIAVLQMLKMLEGDNLSALGFQSSASLHLQVEAMKRAFADRATHLGDADFVPVPVKAMLDPAYLAGRRQEIGDRATPAKEISGMGAGAEGENTTHYTVADKFGNVVANTYTLNTGYGSAVVIPGTGVLMNNEMDDFTSEPGKPNAYGLIQSEKNAIAPGKRPLSSMTPTIVLKKGKPLLVLGSPGGPTIINTVYQTIVNVIDYGMNVQQAVSAPRFHHQWLPDTIRWEPFGLSNDVRKALEAKGHQLDSVGRNMGSCHAIMIGADFRVGVDPRITSAGTAGY